MRNNLRFLLACLAGIAVPIVMMAANPSDPEAARMGLSKYVAPQFPVMATDQALCNGTAAVALAWDETGRPVDIVLLRESHQLFGDSLKEAAKEWRHQPGPATKVVDIFEVNFTTNGIVICSSADVVTQLAQSRPAEPLKLLTEVELDAPLKAVAQPMPAYPRSLVDKGIEAKVVVHFFIDEDGRVRAPTVREATAPEFASEALNAMQKWQFETPRKDGRPVVTTASWSFQFNRNS